MATDPPPLLPLVTDTLDGHRVPYALIGAAAIALHGVGRSTLDIDLLVVDRRVLNPEFWSSLPVDVTRDIRSGDADDPLAGVIRFAASGRRDLDIIVGRDAWQAEVLVRAEATPYHGRAVPTARVEDLILLKLFAGGSQDRWDIEQLLSREDRATVIAAVERSLQRLPPDARRLWELLRGGP